MDRCKQQIGKKVRFAEDFAPSTIKIKIICGPKADPSFIIRLGLIFRAGKSPELRIKMDRCG